MRCLGVVGSVLLLLDAARDADGKCHEIAGVRSSTGLLIDVVSAPY